MCHLCGDALNEDSCDTLVIILILRILNIRILLYTIQILKIFSNLLIYQNILLKCRSFQTQKEKHISSNIATTTKIIIYRR